MSTTIAPIHEEHPRQSSESHEANEDRLIFEAYSALKDKNDRTEAEEVEMESLFNEATALAITKGGYLPKLYTDVNLQPTMVRLRKELEKDFTPLTSHKILLMDQLLLAVSDAASYGKMFSLARYEEKDGRTRWNDGSDNVRFLAEIRKGKDSATDRILRLSQALCDLTRPPIQVKTTNAFFAHNQQFNQGSPKDLEKIPR